MIYSVETQRKVLESLKKNEPHSIEKFINLYNVNSKGEKPKIYFFDILYSNVWDSKEKEELIKLYKYNENEEYKYNGLFGQFTVKKLDSYYGGYTQVDFNLIDDVIMKKNYSSVESLLNLGAYISEETIDKIIDNIEDIELQYKFCELLVNNYIKKYPDYKKIRKIKVFSKPDRYDRYHRIRTIPSLCDCYHGDKKCFGFSTRTVLAPIKKILSTNNMELVKLFLPTIKNINSSFLYVVNSGNIEIAKLFIEAGANVNFTEIKFDDYYKKTPLMIALMNLDFEMVKFLHQNGAQINLNKNLISLIGKNKKKSSLNVRNTFIEILNYLYENITDENKKINYTNLIIFTIENYGYESTKFYFEEALKKGKKIDFTKIIESIYEPNLSNSDRDYSNSIYKTGATPWFRMCEEYSKKMNEKNYNNNLKLILNKIFERKYFKEKYYRDIITEFSKKIPNDIKDIPAFFSIEFDTYHYYNDIEYLLDLGYDINCFSSKYNQNLLMYLIDRNRPNHIINEIIRFGADPNYLDPNYKGHEYDRKTALSAAIDSLSSWEYITHYFYFGSVDRDNTERKINMVNNLIDRTNQDIVKSYRVQQEVYRKFKNHFEVFIYNSILNNLSKKGFKIDDKHFRDMVKYVYDISNYGAGKYISKWKYLSNVYTNFKNKIVDSGFEFPEIESIKDLKYDSYENIEAFKTIQEHLKRNFITTLGQVKKANEEVCKDCYRNTSNNHDYYFEIIDNKLYDRTPLQKYQDKLLSEIKRYIGYLDYRQIMKLLSSYEIIDIDSVNRNQILFEALKKEDINLSKELIKKGVTIVCYNENKEDITPIIYGDKIAAQFSSINSEYNPNSEYDDLLNFISGDKKTLSLKKTKKIV